ncbi:MFS transporter [Nocardioides sp. GXQ0305]|uniref:MFS transporter n=1 Tax=Nocardioides sp. GXQ0305 TaxID=3423912 RepID=UPI003D7CC1DB
MTDVLSPAAARRAFLLLTVARWFPVGLVVGIFTLWFLERGLTVSEALVMFAVTGVVVFALELPTGGLADAMGRRPVLLAAAAVNIVAGTVLILGTSFWVFALGAALQGVFRALDSGPLEAWYVDTVHTTEPDADVDQTLATEGSVMGASMAIGAVVSGGLIVWDPLPASTALLLPMACWVALNVLYLAGLLVLMKEPRTHVDATGLRRAALSAREAPGVVRDGLGLLRHNGVLLSLVLVEVFWIGALVVFETFQPVRLAELVGGEEQAGALMGPIAAAGWGVFALGSALAGRSSRRIGVARTAILARVLNGLGAVVMGLVTGPAGLIAAYLFTYGLHGSGSPMHSALLHREAQARNRATVLSMNSMVFFVAFSIVAPPVGLLAEATTTQVAMVAAGSFSILGALLYLPALRAERRRPQPASV